MPSVSGWVSTPVTELAIVICNPSRIHAAPSPATIRVWNGDHPSRSSRAGTVVRIGAATLAELLIGDPLPAGQHPSRKWGVRRDALVITRIRVKPPLDPRGRRMPLMAAA